MIPNLAHNATSERLRLLSSHLLDLAKREELYVAGGAIRDILLSRPFHDLDLVLPSGAASCARHYADLCNGTLVMLHEQEDVARVVTHEGVVLDFSAFRGRAESIEQDLFMRDFTINAMAVPLYSLGDLLSDLFFLMVSGDGLAPDDLQKIRRNITEAVVQNILDPVGGMDHISAGMISMVSPENMESDPLRMVRAFRFRSELGFSIEDATLRLVETCSNLIIRSAPERISHELNLMFAAPLSGRALRDMYDVGLLQVIIPEINELEGVDQPGFHHLDVLNHCLEAVNCMDRLCMDPGIRFHHPDPLVNWLSSHRDSIHFLKWAALFHDFGKPRKKAVRDDGRVTFYQHDSESSDLVKETGRRLKWSRRQIEQVSLLVRLHMRPFHLLGDFVRSRLTKRAIRRLLRDVGEDYPALFLLAMADSMAGAGPLKPADLDDHLSNLFSRIHSFYMDNVKPVKEAPRLITGRDVMDLTGISPGPVVGKILDAVEAARIEGEISSREQALALAAELASDPAMLQDREEE